MIVVDSSAWIAWIRNVDSLATAKLAALHPRELLVGDIVLLEVLRGARDDHHARALETRLRHYEIATMLDGGLAIKAAANYRYLRSLGITIRGAPDLVIATFCIERGHALLQDDRDFLPMAEHLRLKLV